MANDIWSIVLNLVAAFIYSVLVWLWKNRGQKPQDIPQHKPVTVPRSDSAVADRRTQNIQVLETAAHRFLFYLLTFGALYLSITMPPLFKASFSKDPLFLNQARLLGEYLPAIPISKSYLQITFFLAAATIYWPLLLFSEFITSLAYPIVDAIIAVNQRIWTATTMLASLILCIPIAATSVWLFYEKTYKDSLLTVLFFLLIVFALGQAPNNRR